MSQLARVGPSERAGGGAASEPSSESAGEDGQTGQTRPLTRSPRRIPSRPVWAVDRTWSLETPAGAEVRLRRPHREDAAEVWELVHSSGQLDLNSPYAYLLLCTDFAGTCILAERAGEVIGFIGAYRPPERSNVLFVWQVVTAKQAQGCGIATKMLDGLLARAGSSRTEYLEATVTPSNRASRTLFRRYARRNDVGHEELEDFEADLFPGGSHEEELRVRIGPFEDASAAIERLTGVSHRAHVEEGRIHANLRAT